MGILASPAGRPGLLDRDDDSSDAAAAGGGAVRIYVSRTPFVGHVGHAGGSIHDAAVDVWDWVREVLAMVYYWAKGYV